MGKSVWNSFVYKWSYDWWCRWSLIEQPTGGGFTVNVNGEIVFEQFVKMELSLYEGKLVSNSLEISWANTIKIS